MNEWPLVNHAQNSASPSMADSHIRAARKLKACHSERASAQRDGLLRPVVNAGRSISV